MHEPLLLFHWPAIFASFAACFAIGALWYGPLFGKPWAHEMGMSWDRKPSGKVMGRSLFLQIVGLALMIFVLSHNVQVWRASVWNAGNDGPDHLYGFFSGFFTWLGFYVPLQLSKVAWESRSWKLFWINAAHDFVVLQSASQILAHWRA